MQLPGTFELILTDDLPNGPYGEMGITGSGKVYVAPGSSYDDVAVALIAAWIKSRGSMMQVNVVGKGGARTSYSEEWTIVSLEYKGGTCTAFLQAEAGMHTVNLGLVQNMTPGLACCLIM